jgi:Tat protein secretion system quality control protein TatD with DNase activity
MRGKRNEPSFVKYTGKFLSNLRAEDYADIARQSSNNAKELFAI